MIKYYVDNKENRRLGRVGKPIPKPIRKEKTLLKRGIKVKVDIKSIGKRVTAIYQEIQTTKKIVVIYKDEEFKLDLNSVNLKIL